jgi:hypothetical protein
VETKSSNVQATAIDAYVALGMNPLEKVGLLPVTIERGERKFASRQTEESTTVIKQFSFRSEITTSKPARTANPSTENRGKSSLHGVGSNFKLNLIKILHRVIMNGEIFSFLKMSTDMELPSFVVGDYCAICRLQLQVHSEIIAKLKSRNTFSHTAFTTYPFLTDISMFVELASPMRSGCVFLTNTVCKTSCQIMFERL